MSFFRLYARICSSYHYGNEIDYKVYINEEQIRKNTTSFNRSESTGNTTVNKTKRIINYWAFSPGIAMLELKALGVRSIILTSGTLSPMDALKEDMKLPFNIQLENPHVIEDNQMFVTALANGSTGKTLNSSYNNRDSSSYKDELGISILQICQTMLSRGGVDIPKGRPLRGGILIFFPSYGVMDNAIERWKATGVYEKIKSIYGALLVEPKAGTIDQDKSFIESGSSKVSNKNIVSTEDSGGEYSYNDVVGKFEHAIGRYGGCVLMAVCRYLLYHQFIAILES